MTKRDSLGRFIEGIPPHNKGKCSKIKKECAWCDKIFKSYSKNSLFCCKSCATTYSAIGRKCTKETREKMSRNSWSRKNPELATKNLGNYSKKGNALIWNKGLTSETNESIKKIRDSRTGSKHTRETKEKISLSKTGKNIFTGFKSKEDKIIRNSVQYKKWRKAVFERDNYMCQDCGKSKYYIEAHHIKSFALFPELRFDITNGITYCNDCHIKNDEHRGKNKKGD